MPRFTLTKAAGRGWIGVDLDGTLARYDGWKGAGHVGAPVPAMVDRVKRWLDQGKDVRIFTARAAGGGGRAAIDKFCRDNFGRALPVTAEKDKNMVELWDDRAVGVKANTGEPKCEKGRFYIDLSKSWGAERPGHKYLSRRVNAKGGWDYKYRDERKAGPDQGAEAEPAAPKRDFVKLILDFLMGSGGVRSLTVGQVAHSFRIDKVKAAGLLADLASQGKIKSVHGDGGVMAYKIVPSAPAAEPGPVRPEPVGAWQKEMVREMAEMGDDPYDWHAVVDQLNSYADQREGKALEGATPEGRKHLAALLSAAESWSNKIMGYEEARKKAGLMPEAEPEPGAPGTVGEVLYGKTPAPAEPEPERPANGFMIPKAGDKVQAMVPGLFGMPVVLLGVVSSNGRTVKITGGVPTNRKTAGVNDLPWRVQGDPHLHVAAERARDEANRRYEAEQDEKAKREKMRGDWTAASIKVAQDRGETEVAQDDLKVGDQITIHAAPYDPAAVAIGQYEQMAEVTGMDPVTVKYAGEEHERTIGGAKVTRLPAAPQGLQRPALTIPADKPPKAPWLGNNLTTDQNALVREISVGFDWDVGDSADFAVSLLYSSGFPDLADKLAGTLEVDVPTGPLPRTYEIIEALGDNLPSIGGFIVEQLQYVNDHRGAAQANQMISDFMANPPEHYKEAWAIDAADAAREKAEDEAKQGAQADWKEQAKAKPWTVTDRQYLAAIGVHQPWIAEISPMQIGLMSDRERKRYQEKRGAEWDAAAKAKAEWRAKVYAAYQAGEFTLKDPDILDAVKDAVAGVQVAAKKQTAEQANEQAQTEAVIKSPADVEVGDRIFDLMSGQYAVVLKKFKTSVRVKGERGSEYTRPAGQFLWGSYDDVKAKAAAGEPIRPVRGAAAPAAPEKPAPPFTVKDLERAPIGAKITTTVNGKPMFYTKTGTDAWQWGTDINAGKMTSEGMDAYFISSKDADHKLTTPVPGAPPVKPALVIPAEKAAAPPPVPAPTPAKPMPGEQLGLNFSAPPPATPISKQADESVERTADQVVAAATAVPPETPGEKKARKAREKEGKGSRRLLAVEQGEHVWGSRKDKAELRMNSTNMHEFTPEEQAAMITKAMLMPKAEPTDLLDQGITPGAVLMRRAVEACVTVKPENNLKARQGYLQGVTFLNESLSACKTEADIQDMLTDWHFLARTYRRVGSLRPNEVYDARVAYTRAKAIEDREPVPDFPSYEQHEQDKKNYYDLRTAWLAAWNTKDPKEPALKAAKDAAQFKYDNTREGVNNHSSFAFNVAIMNAMKKSGKLPMTVVPSELTFHDNGDYALEVFLHDPDLGASVKESTYALMAACMGTRFIKLVGNANPAYNGPKIYQDSVKQAKAWDRGKIPPEVRITELHKLTGTKKRETPTTARFQWERNVPGEIQRTGGRPVEVADVQQMTKDFGLTNTQFGGWVTELDAESHIKGLHGALFDLSDLTGADPKAIGFNGRLAMGLGARGGGNARAHYEPMKQIINITKIAGGGAVAHEWAHALDNIIARTADPGGQVAAPYVSEGARRGISTPVVEAFQAVVEAMKAPGPEEKKQYDEVMQKVMRRERLNGMEHALYRKYRDGEAGSDFYLDALALGRKGYWSQTKEMFARCFESYVEDSLRDQKRENTYLVSGTRDLYATYKTRHGDKMAAPYKGAKKEVPVTLPAHMHAQPYPQGEERKRINTAIGKLIQAMQADGTLAKAAGALAALDDLAKARGPAEYHTGPNGGKWTAKGSGRPWRETWKSYEDGLKKFRESWPEGKELNRFEAEHRAADKRKLLELKKRAELSKKVVVPATPEQEARREIEHEAKNPKRVPLPGIMHRGGLAALDDFAKSGEV